MNSSWIIKMDLVYLGVIPIFEMFPKITGLLFLVFIIVVFSVLVYLAITDLPCKRNLDLKQDSTEKESFLEKLKRVISLFKMR